MKFSKSTSAFILANAALTANAFTTPTTSSYKQQKVSSTQHNLVVDADIIGQLALALPVGLGLVSQTNKPTNKDINTLARENIDVLSSEYVDLSKYPKYVDEYNFSAKVRDEGDISEKEVRALFDLWNSALATGDSAVVANRYTKVRGYRCIYVQYVYYSILIVPYTHIQSISFGN